MVLDDRTIRDVLGRARTIAVVGLSDKPERDSNEIARYLRSQGYRVVPVNPTVASVFGESSYPTLTAIPAETPIDIAVVFRRSEQVPPVADEAIARHVPVLWMQLGVENADAAARVRAAGGLAVENSCIMTQHRRLRIAPVGPAAG